METIKISPNDTICLKESKEIPFDVFLKELEEKENTIMYEANRNSFYISYNNDSYRLILNDEQINNYRNNKYDATTLKIKKLINKKITDEIKNIKKGNRSFNFNLLKSTLKDMKMWILHDIKEEGFFAFLSDLGCNFLFAVIWFILQVFLFVSIGGLISAITGGLNSLGIFARIGTILGCITGVYGFFHELFEHAVDPIQLFKEVLRAFINSRHEIKKLKKQLKRTKVKELFAKIKQIINKSQKNNQPKAIVPNKEQIKPTTEENNKSQNNKVEKKQYKFNDLVLDYMNELLNMVDCIKDANTRKEYKRKIKNVYISYKKGNKENLNVNSIEFLNGKNPTCLQDNTKNILFKINKEIVDIIDKEKLQAKLEEEYVMMDSRLLNDEIDHVIAERNENRVPVLSRKRTQ